MHKKIYKFLILLILFPAFAGAEAPAPKKADMPEDLYVKELAEAFFRNVKTMQASYHF